MTPTLVERDTVQVRDARPADNGALLDLATSCAMEGDLSLRVSRAPDFFRLNQLEGERWRVAVAEMGDRIVGCVMVAERLAYLHGVERRTLYTGDLKVHPTARGAGVADVLSRWARDTMAGMASDDTPVLLTILGGNSAMERRTAGRGGVPRFVRFATIRAFSLPLLFPPSVSSAEHVISAATDSDIEEMVALWRRVAPARQLAPVLTPETLRRWIADAPGLEISDYRLARDRSGRLLGFTAWWDQACFKQLHVVRYSPRLRAARTLLNAAARLTGSVTLPAAGDPLRYRTALHVCVTADSVGVLRSLLVVGCAELRAQRYAFATIGLDLRDPLCAALGGRFAQPTDSHAYVCTTGGAYAGAPLDDRPLHYEVALV